MVAGRPQCSDGLLKRWQRLGDVASCPRSETDEPVPGGADEMVFSPSQCESGTCMLGCAVAVAPRLGQGCAVHVDAGRCCAQVLGVNPSGSDDRGLHGGREGLVGVVQVPLDRVEVTGHHRRPPDRHAQHRVRPDDLLG